MSSYQAFTPPRTMVVFSDLAGPSHGARVSSKLRNKAMQKNSPSAQSSPFSASYDRNEGSSGNSRSSISSSEHLVGSNPSGSYPGSGQTNPGSSTNSPPLPASGKGLSTPCLSGASPTLLAFPLSHPWRKTGLCLEVIGVLPQTFQQVLPTHSPLHLSISLTMSPLHPVILRKPILVNMLICGISI